MARCIGSSPSSRPGKARWVTELVVNHRPRTAGRTKYGLGRTFHVVLDLILIRFFQCYAQRPCTSLASSVSGRLVWASSAFIAMLYFKSVFPWPYLWWATTCRPRLSSRPPSLR